MNESEITVLAKEAVLFSGRDIKDSCQNAERQCAARLIRENLTFQLPSLEQYLQSINKRKSQLL